MASNRGVEKSKCRRLRHMERRKYKRGKRRKGRGRVQKIGEEERKKRKRGEKICEHKSFTLKRETSDFGLGNQLGD